MAKKKKNSPLTKALLETAGDMRKAGLMDKASHEKITPVIARHRTGL